MWCAVLVGYVGLVSLVIISAIVLFCFTLFSHFCQTKILVLIQCDTYYNEKRKTKLRIDMYVKQMIVSLQVDILFCVHYYNCKLLGVRD